MSTHRQSSTRRRLLAAAALLLVVAAACQAPGDTTSGETGRTLITSGAAA